MAFIGLVVSVATARTNTRVVVVDLSRVAGILFTGVVGIVGCFGVVGALGAAVFAGVVWVGVRVATARSNTSRVIGINFTRVVVIVEFVGALGAGVAGVGEIVGMLFGVLPGPLRASLSIAATADDSQDQKEARENHSWSPVKV
jgi:hypothetical protein